MVVGLGADIVSTVLNLSDRSLTSIGAVDSVLISIVAYILLQKLTDRGSAANLDEATGRSSL